MGKNAKKKASKVALLDDKEWLSPPLLSALRRVFRRFDTDGDGGLCESELQAFARACNAGTELDLDELDQIQQFFDTDAAGRLTLKGFYEMYHTQTTARCPCPMVAALLVLQGVRAGACAQA